MSFGASINALGRVKQWQRAISLLWQLVGTELPYTVVECCNALTACTGASQWERGLEVLQLISDLP